MTRTVHSHRYSAGELAYYSRSYRLNLQKRQKWIDEHGPCAKCGSWELLEIDHIDPSTKKMEAQTALSSRQEVRDAELAKCQALCRPCHNIKTKTEITTAQHGQDVMYDYHKCRCALCRRVHAEKAKRIRLRTGERYLALLSAVWLSLLEAAS